MPDRRQRMKVSGATPEAMSLAAMQITTELLMALGRNGVLSNEEIDRSLTQARANALETSGVTGQAAGQFIESLQEAISRDPRR